MPLIPLLPKDDVKVRDSFLREVVGKSHDRDRAYWAKRVFTGDGIPPQEVSSEAVIQSVSQDAGYIGVVSLQHVKAGQVNKIHEFCTAGIGASTSARLPAVN